MTEIEDIIRAMVSKRGLDREYTRTDIANRLRVPLDEVTAVMIGGVRNGLVVSDRLGASGDANMVYRLSDAGKDIAQRIMGVS